MLKGGNEAFLKHMTPKGHPQYDALLRPNLDHVDIEKAYDKEFDKFYSSKSARRYLKDLGKVATEALERYKQRIAMDSKR